MKRAAMLASSLRPNCGMQVRVVESRGNGFPVTCGKLDPEMEYFDR